MKIGVCTGTFDPITYGHLDIITRASALFDQLYLCVMINPEKVPLFSLEERLAMLREETGHLQNVVVESYSGLAVDYARKKNASAMVRGLRAVMDFEFEFKLASMNRNLDPSIETLFMMTSSKYSFISSSAVKQVAELGGDVSKWVSPRVAEALTKKFKGRER